MDMDNIHGKEVHVLNVNSIGRMLKTVYKLDLVYLLKMYWTVFINLQL